MSERNACGLKSFLPEKEFQAQRLGKFKVDRRLIQRMSTSYKPGQLVRILSKNVVGIFRKEDEKIHVDVNGTIYEAKRIDIEAI